MKTILLISLLAILGCDKKETISNLCPPTELFYSPTQAIAAIKGTWLEVDSNGQPQTGSKKSINLIPS
jgi:hypothetical protein